MPSVASLDAEMEKYDAISWFKVLHIWFPWNITLVDRPVSYEDACKLSRNNAASASSSEMSVSHP